MSSSLGEKPPATPDNQTLGDSGDRASPPMPPPPPFNTPSGVSTSSAFPTALEASSAVAEDGSAAAVADKLFGLSIREEDEGGDGAGGGIDDGEAGEDGSEDDEDGEENEVELPREVMKRLYQLKALQSEKDVIYEKYKVERAELERKFSALYGDVYSRRAEVVAGRARNIDGSESDATMEDEAGESGVPHFWMQCMLHHEALHDVVCEPDLEALYYLADVRCVDKDNLLGFTLDFHFDDNPYFSNAVLTKRYHTANIMDQGEPLLEGVEGTPIAWKAGRNLCERTIRRKVKRGARSGGGGETRTVTKTEKTESFFKFFQNPVMYDEDDEDDEDEYNFSYDMDYEVALIFRNHLIPNAVLWFTGEAVSEDDEEMDEDDEGDDDGLENAGGFSGGGGDTPPVEEGSEAGEDEESGSAKGSSPKKLTFEAPAGFEAPPSGSVDGKECKQS